MIILNILILFLVLTFLFCIHNSKRCASGEYQKKLTLKPLATLSNRTRFLQNDEWEAIRIHVDYTNLDSKLGQVTQEMIDGIKQVMGEAINAYQQILKVKRLDVPLKIDFCDSDLQISSQVSTTGVEADLVIFPTFNIESDRNVEAYAGACAIDPINGRPVAGAITFTKLSDFSKKNSKYNRSLLVLHELNHILAFNNDLFGNFRKEDGSQYQYEEVVKVVTINEKSTKIITTPKVVEAAKKHFGCNSLEGVELEDQGGLGTAGNHWEQRIMHGDFMVSESLPENVISEISLALFEDSGWYMVNYYTGGLFRYGKNKGCNFLKTKCIQNGESISKNEFPITKEGSFPACFAGRTSKGIAYIQTYTNDLPPEFQYFNNPKLGGNKNNDFCPVAYNSNLDGWYDAESCWIGKSEYILGLGETIGADSNCFYSSLTFSNDNSTLHYKDVTRPICHKVTCDYENNKYTVTIREKTFECDTDGGQISVDGFDGKFYCADFNLICTKTIKCGDVFDCISKKSLRREPLVYTPEESVGEVGFLPKDPNQSSFLKYSMICFYFLLLMLLE